MPKSGELKEFVGADINPDAGSPPAVKTLWGSPENATKLPVEGKLSSDTKPAELRTAVQSARQVIPLSRGAVRVPAPTSDHHLRRGRVTWLQEVVNTNRAGATVQRAHEDATPLLKRAEVGLNAGPPLAEELAQDDRESVTNPPLEKGAAGSTTDCVQQCNPLTKMNSTSF